MVVEKGSNAAGVFFGGGLSIPANTFVARSARTTMDGRPLPLLPLLPPTLLALLAIAGGE